MAPNHISSNRLIYCYPPREEPAQKEERSASILHHKFQKHPLTPQLCAAVLGPRFAHEIILFLITKHNIRKIRLKIDLLKNRLFFGYSSPLRVDSTQGTLVCTAEYQGVGTSLSIFALVSRNFTGFHTHTWCISIFWI